MTLTLADVDRESWLGTQRERVTELVRERDALRAACRLAAEPTDDRFTGIPLESPSHELLAAVQRGMLACRDVLAAHPTTEAGTVKAGETKP